MSGDDLCAAAGCVRYGRSARALWRALGVAGLAGFGTAVGVHPAIGYVNGVHLAPAVLGAAVFAAGLALAASATLESPPNVGAK